MECPSETGARTNLPGKRVLIVDDDPDSADTLRELLAFEGHEPVVAYDGLHALSLAASFQPEVVLLDLDLGSSTTGEDVCRKLCALQMARPRIVALTGYSRNDEERLRGLGFDAYVTKPLEMKTILGLLYASAELHD